RLIPDEAIAIDNGSSEWSNKTAILAGAKRFADSGGKMVRLEFPKNEMQIYGGAIIVYTTYIFEIESNGKSATQSGRGTENFVRRGNELVNAGWHLDSGKGGLGVKTSQDPQWVGALHGVLRGDVLGVAGFFV